MARKSVEFSQSLLQFQRANRKRTERPDSQDDVPSSSGSDGSSKKSRYEKSIGDEMDVESIRLKYIMQNKSLAKTNALMLVKMSDMECKISELINENMRLRNSRPTKDLSLKKELETQVANIETSLFSKFNDILQLLKRIRSTEGLAVNSNLDILSDTTRYTETETEKATLATPSQKKNNEIIEEKNMAGTTSIPPYSDALRRKSSTPSSTPSSQLTSDSISEEPAQKESFKDDNTKANKVESRATRETKLSSQDSILKSSRNIFLDEPKLRFKTPSKFEVYEDDKQKKEIKELKLTKNEDPRKKVMKTKDVILPEYNNTLEDKEVIESGNRRRSSRSTKQVNYAVPSLRGKMRRESVKPLDAVGNDVLINYVVNDQQGSNIKIENTISQDVNAKENNSTKETKKVKSKRKPLTSLNNINPNIDTSTKVLKPNKDTSRKILEPTDNGKLESLGNIKSNDLSIFDFVEDENSTRNVYGGKRALNRRRRRHSMLM